MKPKRPAHWYKLITDYCPVCGNTEQRRERHLGTRPAEADCYEQNVDYDSCIERDGGVHETLCPPKQISTL